MTKNSSKRYSNATRRMLLGLVAVGCLASTVAIYRAAVNPHVEVADTGHIVDEKIAEKNRPDNTITSSSTANKVADIWQKDLFDSQHKENPASEQVKLFNRSLESVVDPDYLYAVLQDVELDQYGDVVLDYKALQALELTVNRGRLKLNVLELAELQELIQIGLPGKPGEQTARIVGDYYNYLGAKEEMGELQLSLEKPTFNSWRQEFQELVKLREMYLGEEVSTSLFSQSDANAEYMFTVMALDHDNEYTEEEKQRFRTEATETLLADLADINNWADRYQHYKNDKQALETSLGGAVSVEDKDQLLSQHFTLAEIEELIHKNLDRML